MISHASEIVIALSAPILAVGLIAVGGTTEYFPWIERLGFPIAVVLIMFFGIWKFITKIIPIIQKVAEKHIEQTDKLVEQTITIQKSTKEELSKLATHYEFISETQKSISKTQDKIIDKVAQLNCD